MLQLLHPQTEHLSHQNMLKPIDCQAGEAVGLAEDDAAAAAVRLAHHRAAVVPRITNAAAPEVGIKAVVGVAGEEAAADGGVAVIKAGTQICAPAADHIDKRPILHGLIRPGHFSGINPRVTADEGALALGGDDNLGIGTLCFHGGFLLS